MPPDSALPVVRHDVSIRARPIGRAMPCLYFSCFQATKSFNPRPADWPGDALLPSSLASRNQFQSAPGRLAGRCFIFHQGVPINTLFQSAPGRLAGRCDGLGDAGGAAGAVSIRARPIGRAMLPEWVMISAIHMFQSAPGRLAGRCAFGSSPTTSRRCFNPRPADWPGDARSQDQGTQGQHVSIRARPIGRAMRQFRINHCRFLEFQSAPGRLAGRCSGSIGLGLDGRGFNPRPADWPGDA